MSHKLAIRGGTAARTRPFPAWPIFDERERTALDRVLSSRNWGGYPCPNDNARQFAQAFADYHGAKYGATVSNGTVSLELALEAAGIGGGDEVIIPAYTWEGTAAAVLFAGAVPVFVDVDPDSYCLDTRLVEAAVTSRTKAIIPVHLGFRFVDMDALEEIARKYNLFILEDCAHAHGGKWSERGAGSIGNAGSFSFQTSKLMTAGEGGIVITNDIDIADAVIRLSNCGRPPRRESKNTPAIGHNYRMTEFQAAVLLVQLERLKEQTELRAQNMNSLEKRLQAIEGVSLLRRDERITTQAAYHFVFRFHSDRFEGVTRDAFVAALAAEGIPCDGRFYEAVYRSPLFRIPPTKYPQIAEYYCPVAERAGYAESVWLPHQLFLGDERDVIDIADAIEKIRGNAQELTGFENEAVRIRSLSRAERALLESRPPY